MLESALKEKLKEEIICDVLSDIPFKESVDQNTANIILYRDLIIRGGLYADNPSYNLLNYALDSQERLCSDLSKTASIVYSHQENIATVPFTVSLIYTPFDKLRYNLPVLADEFEKSLK